MAVSMRPPRSARIARRPSTALLVSRIELSIKCRDLPNMDTFSLTDPICVLFVQDISTGKWVEYGKTECIDNNLNPDFAKRFEIDYFFEERQQLRFEIYDIDSKKSVKLEKENFIGFCDIPLGEIVAASPIRRRLRTLSKLSINGEIIITAEEIAQTNDALLLEINAKNVDRKNLFGKSDPYLAIHKVNPDGSTTLVHRTEVIKNTLNPVWAPFTIPLRSLCGSDRNRPILFKCFDWSHSGTHELIGSFSTSLDGLLSTPQEQMAIFELDNSEIREKKKNYKNSGLVKILRVALKKHYNFVDYLRAGTRLRCTIAIDFTTSNGPPSDPSSLHHLDPNGHTENGYEKALIALCTILQDYNRDGKFAVYGFGAIPFEGDGETVSHQFPMNGNPFSAECVGVDGVLAAYRRTLHNVILHGPTCFAPIVGKIAAQAYEHENGSGYELLVILTNGMLTDLKETTETIVNASTLPLSIVIVGIGDGDFSAMEFLDGDEHRLSSGGVEAARDIVQFVRLNRFSRDERLAEARLAKEVLAEVPEQFMSFMRANNIEPKKRT